VDISWRDGRCAPAQDSPRTTRFVDPRRTFLWSEPVAERGAVARTCTTAVSRTIARSIASAMLAGEWSEDEMIARVAECLGGDARTQTAPWLRALVRYARATFPAPPRDRRDAFANVLRRGPAWSALPLGELRIRKLVVDTPAMGAMRFAVPSITTTRDLGYFLGLERRELDALADRRNLSRIAKEPRMRHYHYQWLPKPDGTRRLIEIPKSRLRAVQRTILREILDLVPPHESAHGFRRGRSVLDFVQPHVGRRVLIRMDLELFFQTIFAARVHAVFRALGYPEEVSRTLCALCTNSAPHEILAQARPQDRPRLRTPHLPQGAPTSPALANLIAYGLDVRLAALAHSRDGTYGRYADDLAISGGESLSRGADSTVGLMMGIAMDEGFSVNRRKTRVQRASTRQSLAGIVVNHHAAWPREERQRFEAILHNCARTGPEAQNRDGVSDFRAHLLGRLSWLAEVDPARATLLRRVFDAIAWT
jgi:hypothetical protein